MRSALESKALSGGVALVARQMVGIALSIASMLISTRLLGPHKYGHYAIITGLMGYATVVGKMGLDVYLIRRQGDLYQDHIGVTQCLYSFIGIVIVSVGLLLGPLAAKWYGEPDLRGLLWAYAVVPPMTLMSGVPIALLDRRLEYKKSVKVELSGQVVYVAVSLLIVVLTRTVWGLVLGAICQAAVSLIMAVRLSGMKFRPSWDAIEAKAQLRYGLGYASSGWIWQMRNLVNPVIVGKMLGAEAVAYVAMAIRLATLVGFAKLAIWRVYMSFLARLSDDREKMRKAIESGLSLQVLVLGVSFIGFLVLAPEIVRGLMGAKWMPILVVFPFIAAGMMVNGGFSLHSSALYVTGYNWDVSRFHVAHILMFAAGAVFFIHAAGSITGYGLAEVAAFASYRWIRNGLRRRLFTINESRLYMNIAIGIAGMALMSGIQGSALWVRMLTGLAFLLAMTFGIPTNRAASLGVLGEMTTRFSLKNA